MSITRHMDIWYTDTTSYCVVDCTGSARTPIMHFQQFSMISSYDFGPNLAPSSSSHVSHVNRCSSSLPIISLHTDVRPLGINREYLHLVRSSKQPVIHLPFCFVEWLQGQLLPSYRLTLHRSDNTHSLRCHSSEAGIHR